MNYRRDGRSLNEFKKDIKKCSYAERDMIIRWTTILGLETGKSPTFENYGCDNSGEYLTDKEVNLNADYLVEGYGQVEVKFSFPMLTKVFHLKTDQVLHYLKQKSNVLFVNGWETDKPEYSFITPDVLESSLRDAEIVRFHGFGGKEAYRISVGKLAWKPFTLPS